MPPDLFLVGIGLYTSREAERLIGVAAGKISRWLRGHSVNGKFYEPLWTPQVDLRDGQTYLGFRDLMEMRTAHAFMHAGVSAVAIRKAIIEARKLVEDERPLSTTKFKTDGHTIFLEVVADNEDVRLLDLFRKQFTFKKIIEQSLSDVEFDGIAPNRWWPASKAAGILVDPERSFGQPIEDSTGIPTKVLAAAVQAEGSVENAARAWMVRPTVVRKAVEFENTFVRRAA